MPQEMNFRVHFHLGEACVVEIMFWFFVTINEQTTSEKNYVSIFLSRGATSFDDIQHFGKGQPWGILIVIQVLSERGSGSD